MKKKRFLPLSPTTESSEFAIALKQLLDGTDLFSRAEWAQYLAVSQAAISQWLTDKTLPTALHLRMILAVLEQSDNVALAPLQAFREMARKPVQKVTPLFDRTVTRTIAHLVAKPMLEGFSHAVNRLSGQQQELVVATAVAICRQLSSSGHASTHTFASSISVAQLVEKLALLEPERQEEVLKETLQVCDRHRSKQQIKTAQVDGINIVHSAAKFEFPALRLAAYDEEPVAVKGVFTPGLAEQGFKSGETTTIVGMWDFRGSKECKGLAVDELCLVALAGSCTLKLSDCSEVQFGAGEGQQRLLWLPGSLDGTGTPEFIAHADDQTTLLMILYKRDGVAWTGPDSRGEIMITESAARGSRSISHHANHAEFRPRSEFLGPFLSPVHSEEGLLATIFAQSGCKRRSQAHDAARDHGQLVDVDLPKWGDFRDRFKSQSTRKTTMDFRYLKFPPTPASRNLDEIWLAKHPDGYEVIVPLIGTIRCVGATVPSDSFDSEAHDYQFKDLGITRYFDQGAEAAVDTHVLPAVIEISSDRVFHGFTAANKTPAYALHIRVNDNRKPTQIVGDRVQSMTARRTDQKARLIMRKDISEIVHWSHLQTAKTIAPALSALQMITRARTGLGGSHTVVTYPPLDALDRIDPRVVTRSVGPVKDLNLYAHLAFCEHLCPFCHYAKTFSPIEGASEGVISYLHALEAEAEIWASRISGSTMASLYIGGGTPTVLPTRQLLRLIDCLYRIPRSDTFQACIETSPLSVRAPEGRAKLAALVEVGINRVSIGIQSFDDELLRRSRGHGLADVVQALEIVLACGVTTNVDLIQDLPDQTDESLLDDLAWIERFHPDQVTWYVLRLHRESKWFHGYSKGTLTLATVMESARRRLLIREGMRRLGYQPQGGGRFRKQCVPNDEYKAVRNSTTSTLLGLGVSAYSHGWNYFFRNVTAENTKVGIRAYIDAISRRHCAIETGLALSELETVAGAVVSGLRSGVALPAPSPATNNYLSVSHKLLSKLADCGFTQKDETEVWTLTELGALFEEEICSLFYSEPVVRTLIDKAEWWGRSEAMVASPNNHVDSPNDSTVYSRTCQERAIAEKKTIPQPGARD